MTSVGREKKRERRTVIAQRLSIHQRKRKAGELNEGGAETMDRSRSSFREQENYEEGMLWWESCRCFHTRPARRSVPAEKARRPIQIPPSVQNPQEGRSRSPKVTFQQGGGRKEEEEEWNVTNSRDEVDLTSGFPSGRSVRQRVTGRTFKIPPAF